MFWHKISLELFFLAHTETPCVIDFDVFLVVSQPSQPIAVASYRHMTTLTSLLPVYSNLVFGQSRNKKRKHRKVSVGNCTAVCFSVICYCSVLHFAESNSTDCTWRLVCERETAVGLSCEIHGKHLTRWIRQRYSTEKRSYFVVVWLFDYVLCYWFKKDRATYNQSQQTCFFSIN